MAEEPPEDESTKEAPPREEPRERAGTPPEEEGRLTENAAVKPDASPRRIPLSHATAKGITSEYWRGQETLKKAQEDLGEARRYLYLLRVRNRSLGRQLKLMYLVCFILFLCVAAQLLMVHYLMQGWEL